MSTEEQFESTPPEPPSLSVLGPLLSAAEAEVRQAAQSERSPQYLEIIRGDGSHVTLFYASILWVAFEPKRGQLTVRFSTHTVHIEGDRLHDLHDQILKHSLRLLQATSRNRNAMQVESGPIVKKVVVNQTPGPETGQVFGDGIGFAPDEEDAL